MGLFLSLSLFVYSSCLGYSLGNELVTGIKGERDTRARAEIVNHKRPTVHHHHSWCACQVCLLWVLRRTAIRMGETVSNELSMGYVRPRDGITTCHYNLFAVSDLYRGQGVRTFYFSHQSSTPSAEINNFIV